MDWITSSNAYYVVFSLSCLLAVLTWLLDKTRLTEKGVRAFLVWCGISYTLFVASPVIGPENTEFLVRMFITALIPVTLYDYGRHLMIEHSRNKFWEKLTTERKKNG